MNNLKFDSLINLKLTQESGQTSQSPWKYNSVGNTDEFSELIYLKVPSIIDVLNDETINLFLLYFKEFPLLEHHFP